MRLCSKETVQQRNCAARVRVGDPVDAGIQRAHSRSPGGSRCRRLLRARTCTHGKRSHGETQVRVLSSNGKRVHCSITWRAGCHNCRLGLQIQMRCMQETRGSGEGECRGGWRGCVEYGMCGGCVWWRKPMLGAPVLHAMRSLEISMHGSAVEATRSKGSGPKRSEIEKPRATVPPRLDHAS